jgi:hypothetical protein
MSQYSPCMYSALLYALCYARAAEGGAGGKGRRKSLGLLVAGGKAAGAWVVPAGGRGGRRHAMEERMYVIKGLALWRGGKTSTMT